MMSHDHHHHGRDHPHEDGHGHAHDHGKGLGDSALLWAVVINLVLTAAQIGGGLVAGAVVLVAGEPGIGKSTLLLDVAARAATCGAWVTATTCTVSERRPRRTPMASATAPPTPVSISCNSLFAAMAGEGTRGARRSLAGRPQRRPTRLS